MLEREKIQGLMAGVEWQNLRAEAGSDGEWYVYYVPEGQEGPQVVIAFACTTEDKDFLLAAYQIAKEHIQMREELERLRGLFIEFTPFVPCDACPEMKKAMPLETWEYFNRSRDALNEIKEILNDR